MPDRGAVWDHFASSISAYRQAADAWKWYTPLSSFRQIATPNGTRGSSRGLKRHSSEIRISSAKLMTTRRPVVRC